MTRRLFAFPSRSAPATTKMTEVRPCVLLVDTDREVLHVLPLVLGRFAAVRAVSDLDEAVRAAQQDPFQVLVISTSIVEQGAVELVRALRGRQPCAQVMVLCEKGYTEVSAAFLAEGVGDRLVKPFDAAVLRTRIEHLVAVTDAQLKNLEKQRDLEARLRHTDRMAILGTLVATVAHDTANPLSVVLSNGELMNDLLSASSEIEPADREWLHCAVRDTVSAARAINTYLVRILRYARTQQEVRSESSPTEAIATALLFVRPRCQEKRAALHLYIPEQVPVVSHYPVALAQAIANALSNAIDAVDAGGNVWLRLVETPNELEIVIEDDGPGLSADQEQRFFEPFYTTKATGTGLGSVVMGSVMREHGGRVELRQRDGGTGLSVRLVLWRGDPHPSRSDI